MRAVVLTAETAEPLPQDQVACRRRHPSTGPVGDGPALVRAVARRLAAAGLHHAEVAASVMAARAGAGRSVEGFAVALGIPVATVLAAEGGDLAEADLPPPLRQVLRTAA